MNHYFEIISATGFELPKTAAIVKRYLDLHAIPYTGGNLSNQFLLVAGWGIDSRTSGSEGHGVLAKIDGTGNKSILLRADMDA